MEMHPGKDPGRMVDMQVVITETQFLGSPIGDFLGHVHERGGFQIKGSIRFVTGDADILTELVTFSSDYVHTANLAFASAKLALITENFKFLGRIQELVHHPREQAPDQGENGEKDNQGAQDHQ